MTNPVSIWRCNEGAGYTLYDYLKHFDLSDANSYEWSSGHGDNAYSYDPRAGRVYNGNTYSFSSDGNFACAYWFCLTSNQQGCIARLNPGSSGVGSDNLINWFYDSDNNRHASITAVELNTWHHMGIVVTASGTYQFYLDGQPDGNGTCYADSSRTLVYFGSWFGGSSYTYPGYINDFHMWSSAVTQADIIDAMNGAYYGHPVASRFRGMHRNNLVRYA